MNNAKYKILLVEDEDSLRLIYREYLSDDKNLQVMEASDGEQALKIAKENAADLDLILLDLMLPKKDGIKVLEELKSDIDTKDIKVYLMTVLDRDAVIKKTLNLGADGYLIKDTLTPEEVKEEIYKALQNS